MNSSARTDSDFKIWSKIGALISLRSITEAGIPNIQLEARHERMHSILSLKANFARVFQKHLEKSPALSNIGAAVSRKFERGQSYGFVNWGNRAHKIVALYGLRD